jgi:DNA-binding response OmpR family regulator
MIENQRLHAGQRLVLAIDDAQPAVRHSIQAISSITGCVIDLVGSLQAAHERLTMARCDALIMPIDSRGDSLGLIKRIRASHALAFTAIIVVLQEWQRGLAPAIYDTEADAVVIGVPDPEMVRAQVRQAMRRVERWRRQAASRSPSLAGDDSAFALPDLIGFLAAARRTGLLEVMTVDGHQADLVFKNGSMERALYRNRHGEEAVTALIADYAKARFTFTPDREGSDEVKSTRRITRSVNGMLLDAAREADDAKRHGGTASGQRLYTRPTTLIMADCEPAMRPSSHILVQVGSLLLDDANLAEVSFVTLSKIKAQMIEPHLIRILVVAGTESIPHLLALASPPEPDQLMMIMEDQVVALRLRIQSGTNGLEILIVDPVRVKAVVEALSAGPHVILMAPDGGTWDGFMIPVQRALLAAVSTIAPLSVALSGQQGSARRVEEAFAVIGRQGQRVMELGQMDGSHDIREILTTSLAGLR